MILFSSKKLIEKWNENKISQIEKLKYLILTTIWITTGYYLPKAKSTFEVINSIEIIATLIISISGLYWIYKKNGYEEGQNLIEKFIIFSIPAAIRTLCLSFITVFIWSATNEYLTTTSKDILKLKLIMDGAYLILINLTQAFYYILIGKYLAKLRR